MNEERSVCAKDVSPFPSSDAHETFQAKTEVQTHKTVTPRRQPVVLKSKAKIEALKPKTETPSRDDP